jgi:hypothetical protein
VVAEWPSIPRSFNGLSAQVITIDTPAYVDSSQAADTAKHETSHESNFVPYPPSNPTKDCHAKKDTELVHILPKLNDSELPITSLTRCAPPAGMVGLSVVLQFREQASDSVKNWGLRALES